MPISLPRSFYERPVLEVAADLLDARISHGGVTVRLTEVEAYAGLGDPGSHAFRGQTPRTATLFGPPGGLYVYFTYGMHWCANLVCGPPRQGAAVLLRAGEVIAGEERARERRGGVPARDLARGPARLTVTLGLGRDHDGLLTTAPDCPVVVLAADGPPKVGRAGPPAAGTVRTVRSGPRVGVSGPGGDGAAYP
ncbi:MAG: DNA-3-methyladenine glycosylase, partial [Candidatus Phosphoribacter sp.]